MQNSDFMMLCWNNRARRKTKSNWQTFIEVFDDEAHLVEDVKWLAQGTIYPDVIESVSANYWYSSAYYKIASQCWWIARFYEIKSG